MSEMITIPNGWENLELGKILKVETGSKNAEDSSEDGIYPFFTRAETTQKIDAYSYDTEALFIAGEGHFRVKYYKGKFEVHQRTYMLTSKNKENTHLPFLQKAIQPKIFQLINTSVGSTVMSLRKPIIENIEILLPKSKKEQEKIAEILSELDSAIDKAEAYYEKNRKIKIALMQDLLTHGIDENGKIRNPKTHQYKDSSLGDIPIDWDIKYLKNISNKIGDGIHTTPKYTINTKYSFVNGNNLVNGKIVIDSNTNTVSENEYNKYKIELTKRTILMSINGTIGNLAIYTNENIVLGKSACYIKLKEEINLDFMMYLLNSDFILKYFDFELTGSTIKNLSLKTIRNTLVPFPSKTEQQKIAQILSSQDEKIEKAKAKLEKLKSLKTALMQDLLSGTKRVNHLLGEEI